MRRPLRLRWTVGLFPNIFVFNIDVYEFGKDYSFAQHMPDEGGGSRLTKDNGTTRVLQCFAALGCSYIITWQHFQFERSHTGLVMNHGR